MNFKQAQKRTKQFLETLMNLFIRWLDESEYEDINDYYKVIKKVEPRAIEMTTEPFGVKINDNGKIRHIVAEIQDDNIIIGERG